MNNVEEKSTEEAIRQISERAERSARATDAARAADRRRAAETIGAGFKGTPIKISWR